MRLAYLVDVFVQLNLLMKGRNTNIVKFVDALTVFMSKLENWMRMINEKCCNA